MTRTTIRAGAASLVLGVLLTLAFTLVHPSRVDPADSAAVFAEYAESDAWLTVHLGQLIGTLLVLAGLIVLFVQALDHARLRVVAWAGIASAVIAAVIIGILQAVDGVSLKRMADLYAEGGADPASAAFFAAEAVRWVEVGINAVYRMFLGVTTLLAGVLIVMGATYPRWFGWVGAGLAVIAWIVRGVVVWYTGFTNLGIVALPSPLAALWLLALAVLMWRTAGQQVARPTASPT